jgi:hypothetical protein
MTDTRADVEPAILSTLRRLLLLVVSLGMLGTAADLLLIEHYDGWTQLPPLVLIAFALLVIVWTSVRGGAAAVAIMRVTMVCFVAAGVAGVALHYNGNREFQHEIDPTLQGWALVVKVMRAKAPPALAPGVMVQLGLLGLLYTYGHPSLRRGAAATYSERSTR